jgi:hypothetical protein
MEEPEFDIVMEAPQAREKSPEYCRPATGAEEKAKSTQARGRSKEASRGKKRRRSRRERERSRDRRRGSRGRKRDNSRRRRRSRSPDSDSDSSDEGRGQRKQRSRKSDPPAAESRRGDARALKEQAGPVLQSHNNAAGVLPTTTPAVTSDRSAVVHAAAAPQPKPKPAVPWAPPIFHSDDLKRKFLLDLYNRWDVLTLEQRKYYDSNVNILLAPQECAGAPATSPSVAAAVPSTSSAVAVVVENATTATAGKGTAPGPASAKPPTDAVAALKAKLELKKAEVERKKKQQESVPDGGSPSAVIPPACTSLAKQVPKHASGVAPPPTPALFLNFPIPPSFPAKQYFSGAAGGSHGMPSASDVTIKLRFVPDRIAERILCDVGGLPAPSVQHAASAI